MNEIVCPYLHYQVQWMGCGDVNTPFQRETAICYAQKHKPSCQYGGMPDDCPILNKELLERNKNLRLTEK